MPRVAPSAGGRAPSAPARSGLRASAGAMAWLLALATLIGLTLDSTHPYQGDETYYIKASVGMVRAGGFLVPRHDGDVRLQKPILAYWLTALGYKVFGIALWSGRVPFLLLAAAMLFAVYRFAWLLFEDQEAALLALALLSSSLLFLLFSRVSMTDLPLALFSTLALYFFSRAIRSPGHEQRDVLFAYLSMGAGFLAKGAVALMPLAAVTIHLALARPAGSRTTLRRLFDPRSLVAFALVALPWYAYLWLAYPGRLRSQLASEAADNLGPGTAVIAANVLFYCGALVVYQIPAWILTGWAWWKGRAGSLRDSGLDVLGWYVGISLGVFILLFAHHRDRYLLMIVPALSLIAARVIHQGGVARSALRLAAIAAIIQAAGIGVHGYVVGRPLHDLVGYWQHHLRGQLAVQSLGDRESTWALAISGGRLSPSRGGIAYVVTPARQREQFPDYEVVRRASRATRLVIVDGRLGIEREEFVLLGLRGGSFPETDRR